MRLPDQLPVKFNMEHLLLDEPSAVSVPLHPPTRAQVLADEAGAREFVRAWQVWQPAEEVEWATRSWAGLGKQDVPVRVTLSGWDRVAEVAGRAGEVALARERFAVLVGLFPDWPEFRERAAHLWSSWLGLSDDDFTRLCLALRWFHVKPSSGLRARAVPIEGLDTKWIAAHRGLLQRLLGVSDLGLAEGDRLMRVRFLDGGLAPAPGLLDVAVPFGSLDLPDGLLVIVVENKETFLALPQAPVGSGAVLVWGSGYTAGALPELPWVRAARRVLYWGDADADGYAILNTVRTRLSADGCSVSVVSAAMDIDTVQRFLHLAVADPGDTARVLPRLTEEEERARRFLIASGNKRLEQERVSLDWALSLPQLAPLWDRPSRDGAV
ncbi:hypothetical protein HMPREF3171_04520 [Corynebacterium sp. HMSC08F01]|uniref:DUF3322 domain-containing protein n=1 Tax=Corynebacterium sp. HMSC08F01 TaxID=1581139 RepID=UPI0008A24420|nr:DUF3322 domain-containing protein [Corynebacterium sp. HMSC08F01]OFT30103.1 hypothetical protein HMPREF3171_04520 [Corynebacterium sp. HMSC08F01]